MSELTGYMQTPFYETLSSARRYDYLLIAATCFAGVCLTVLHFAW
ncbi:MAG TPA: hypothetical protein VHL58_09845 [Thermoanaerobaculia bacterium]|nr:hypothetical protein [Thermoanaerobaculia bacterium]